MMQPLAVLSAVILVLDCVQFGLTYSPLIVPEFPQAARRPSRPPKRPTTQYHNPLIASRQVKTDRLRSPPKKAKRACPSFLPNGNCACPAGTVYCTGQGDCINVLGDDPENCGGCGAQCNGDLEVCTAGTCGCVADYGMCNGQCTYTGPVTTNTAGTIVKGYLYASYASAPSTLVCYYSNVYYGGNIDGACYSGAGTLGKQTVSTVAGGSMVDISAVGGGQPFVGLGLYYPKGAPMACNYASFAYIQSFQADGTPGTATQTMVWSVASAPNSAGNYAVTATWVNADGSTCPVTFLMYPGATASGEQGGYTVVATCDPSGVSWLGDVPIVLSVVPT